ncbi:carboxypeptidase regulatory-like domain-containing protein [Bacteroides ovatus]|nr:carboxypeptidase regulatory-like domain-containing protein [Bacteroides ovatus]MDC2622101.1 carboxypeptidase regulatory-like domain-containing protein [Bacteroides ovatus]MDC2636033.1 carboxypeptidase regulatory-like domain-containing protein [Bacteroides ovatus]
MRSFLVLVMLLLTTTVSAQVTTASMSGKVVDASNESLIGATVRAVHTPTGTIYNTVTQSNGQYRFQNLRIGGPYTVEFSYVGFNPEKVSNINLVLGEDHTLNIVMKEDAQTLGEVLVVADRSSVISSNRTGAQEIITRDKMDKMPSLSHSLTDFTKLTPMSSGSNFAGTSYRFNNVTVDGASFNNSFGLSSSLGAAGTEPISLEALEQVQVMIAPYDVRNGAFTGAGINSVTKSGSNQWHASAYMYTKSPSMTGYRQKDDINTVTEFSNHQYGISLSGPIIKNKLFFYLNGEMDRQEKPVNYKPRATKNDEVTGEYSFADAQTLEQLSQFLQNKFDYNPGTYNVGSIPTEADRITARVDWNINQKNTLSVKYFYLKSFATNSPSTSGAPTNGRGANSYAIPFSSCYYRTNNNFNIVMADLVTNINDRMSNTLKVGYSALRDYRDMDGGFFPQVDILDGTSAGNAFTTFGTEVNSYNNMLNSDIYQIQDNFTWIIDKHQLTFGTQSDYRKFKNGYGYSFAGSWRYSSVDSFYEDANNYLAWKEAGADPATRPTTLATSFSQKYAVQGNGFPYAYVDILSLGFYVQDKWTVTPNLNLTLGLRIDTPIFLTDLDKNDEAAGLTFQGGEKIDVSKYPKTKPLLSPRLGVNWNVFGDGKLQVRGGTGIFSGTPPYVWLSNQAGNNGLLFGDLAKGRPFDGIALVTPTAADIKSSKMDLAVTDRDFKYPQLWKTNFAVDYSFGDGWIATVEMLYNKDLNAIYHRNIGLNDPVGYVQEGSGKERPFFATGVATDSKTGLDYPTGYYITDRTTNVIQMKNTSKGYSFYTTLQLQKNFYHGVMKGLYLNGSYSFGKSKSVTDGSSSVASSAWKYRPAVNPNVEETGYASGSFRGRLLLQAAYTAEWSKNASTSIGAIYQMYQPFRYSYTYNGDVNGDGQNMNDLIYIPKDRTDINIVPATGDERSADDIWKQIDAFIKQDNYLSKHRGEYAERNGAITPWAHQLDINITHDIKLPLKNGQVHTLRFSFDIANFLNLLNKDWGVKETTVYGSSSSPQYQFLTMTQAPTAANGYKPGFTMPLNNKKVVTDTFKDLNEQSSRWQMQFGIKYFF